MKYVFNSDKLIELRKSRKLSREGLRLRTGISVQSITNLENYKDRNYISLRIIGLLANYFQVPITKLIKIID